MIVVETDLIAAGPRETRYETASGPGTAPAEGALVLATFAPEATAGSASALLARRDATIVDGPHSGGLYRHRIAPGRLSEA